MHVEDMLIDGILCTIVEIAICPQLTALITKTVLRRVCCLQRVTSKQPAPNMEFRPQNVYTSTTACLEKCSFVRIMKA